MADTGSKTNVFQHLMMTLPNPCHVVHATALEETNFTAVGSAAPLFFRFAKGCRDPLVLLEGMVNMR